MKKYRNIQVAVGTLHSAIYDLKQVEPNNKIIDEYEKLNKKLKELTEYYYNYLEKQKAIPKKVVEVEWCYACPDCDTCVYNPNEQKTTVCNRCKQTLDWSDKE